MNYLPSIAVTFKQGFPWDRVCNWRLFDKKNNNNFGGDAVEMTRGKMML